MPLRRHVLVKDGGVQHLVQFVLVDVPQKGYAKEVVSFKQGHQQVWVFIVVADVDKLSFDLALHVVSHIGTDVVVYLHLFDYLVKLDGNSKWVKILRDQFSD